MLFLALIFVRTVQVTQPILATKAQLHKVRQTIPSLEVTSRRKKRRGRSYNATSPLDEPRTDTRGPLIKASSPKEPTYTAPAPTISTTTKGISIIILNML